jgi:hypothetical protein
MTRDDDRQNRQDPSGSPQLYPYTQQQWDEIEKSFAHLQPDDQATVRARRRLLTAARGVIQEVVTGPALAEHKTKAEQDWRKISELVKEIKGLLRVRLRLDWIYTVGAEQIALPHKLPPELWSDDWPILYRDIPEGLIKLEAIADQATRVYGQRDERYPKTTPQVWFKCTVLDVWSCLGGRLRFSSHPRTHKVRGPLARYFSAATQPVMGGSLESLPDMIARHHSLQRYLEKYSEKHHHLINGL